MQLLRMRKMLIVKISTENTTAVTENGEKNNQNTQKTNAVNPKQSDGRHQRSSNTQPHAMHDRRKGLEKFRIDRTK